MAEYSRPDDERQSLIDGMERSAAAWFGLTVEEYKSRLARSVDLVRWKIGEMTEMEYRGKWDV